MINRNFFPKKGSVSHGIQFMGMYFFDERFHKTDNESALTYLLTFRNRSTITVAGFDTYIKLLRPFTQLIPEKRCFRLTQNHWNTVYIQYASKPQRVFTYLFEIANGGYYQNGGRFTVAGQIGYRFQPYVNLILNASYNELRLPQPYGTNKFWLISPRAVVTFTNNLYFTTFVQYNEQAKNMNINGRLQWRYKPASDLFIVYGDNSIPSTFAPKNRFFTIKWIYWWNI